MAFRGGRLSAAAVATGATGLGVLLLGIGIALWVRAWFAEEIARARLKIDRDWGENG